jgi:Tfp pilus assembly protein PilF
MELDSGETASAISEFETAMRLSPSSEKFHENLADAYKAVLRLADAQRERWKPATNSGNEIKAVPPAQQSAVPEQLSPNPQ